MLETNLKVLGEVIVQQIADYNYKEGISAWLSQDYATAYELFKESAKTHPIAQYHMGCMLYCGQGTSKDYLRAVTLFEKAATQVPQAIYALSKIYLYGSVGVVRDKQKALKWLNIIATEDQEYAAVLRDTVEQTLNHDQILKAQRASKEWIKENPSWNQWIILTTTESDDTLMLE
ncbi:tetratricopeptide repeat protein [Salidesulfovibrio brasiliensis]|uniref:tetratricopeptide repeat protein n=1 Tax=Salidesulfovibrio brasiliensis TaxID=221711 RepID=UPI0006D05F9A|nr:tetratricopeptide repeat protein [Salidesulfovibrio brasiliensis]